MHSVTMNDGNKIPQLGYGVFQMTSDEVRACLPRAIEAGYRHIDTANMYLNERAVGEVIAACGVPREELFVTTKFFPQSYPYEKCAEAIDKTLARLGLDYIDLLLFHQPYGEYVDGWRVMEEAVRAGKVNSIGLSNFSVEKVQEVLDVATIKPAVLQVEINPYWNQHELKAELAEHGITFVGWYPLGHGEAGLLNAPVFTELAARYGKTPAQVIMRWHIQEGNVVFPKTLSPAHMDDNLDIFDFELTEDEMARINALPQKAYYHVTDEAPEWAMAEVDVDAAQQ